MAAGLLDALRDTVDGAAGGEALERMTSTREAAGEVGLLAASAGIALLVCLVCSCARTLCRLLRERIRERQSSRAVPLFKPLLKVDDGGPQRQQARSDDASWSAAPFAAVPTSSVAAPPSQLVPTSSGRTISLAPSPWRVPTRRCTSYVEDEELAQLMASIGTPPTLPTTPPHQPPHTAPRHSELPPEPPLRKSQSARAARSWWESSRGAQSAAGGSASGDEGVLVRREEASCASPARAPSPNLVKIWDSPNSGTLVQTWDPNTQRSSAASPPSEPPRSLWCSSHCSYQSPRPPVPGPAPVEMATPYILPSYSAGASALRPECTPSEPVWLREAFDDAQAIATPRARDVLRVREEERKRGLQRSSTGPQSSLEDAFWGPSTSPQRSSPSPYLPAPSLLLPPSREQSSSSPPLDPPPPPPRRNSPNSPRVRPSGESSRPPEWDVSPCSLGAEMSGAPAVASPVLESPPSPKPQRRWWWSSQPSSVLAAKAAPRASKETAAAKAQEVVLGAGMRGALPLANDEGNLSMSGGEGGDERGGLQGQGVRADASPLRKYTFGPGPLGLGVTDTPTGEIRISEVHSDSVASDQGVQVGSIVLRLNGIDVRGLGKFGLINMIRNLPRPITLAVALRPPEAALVDRNSACDDHAYLEECQRACAGRAAPCRDSSARDALGVRDPSVASLQSCRTTSAAAADAPPMTSSPTDAQRGGSGGSRWLGGSGVGGIGSDTPGSVAATPGDERLRGGPTPLESSERLPMMVATSGAQGPAEGQATVESQAVEAVKAERGGKVGAKAKVEVANVEVLTRAEDTMRRVRLLSPDYVEEVRHEVSARAVSCSWPPRAASPQRGASPQQRGASPPRAISPQSGVGALDGDRVRQESVGRGSPSVGAPLAFTASPCSTAVEPSAAASASTAANPRCGWPAEVQGTWLSVVQRADAEADAEADADSQSTSPTRIPRTIQPEQVSIVRVAPADAAAAARAVGIGRAADSSSVEGSAEEGSVETSVKASEEASSGAQRKGRAISSRLLSFGPKANRSSKGKAGQGLSS